MELGVDRTSLVKVCSQNYALVAQDLTSLTLYLQIMPHHYGFLRIRFSVSLGFGSN